MVMLELLLASLMGLAVGLYINRRLPSLTSKTWPKELVYLQAVAYGLIYWLVGVSWTGLIGMLLFSVLWTLSLIDIACLTVNQFLLGCFLGLAISHLFLDGADSQQWLLHGLTLIGTGLILVLIWRLSNGRLGGGDVKLMAVAGLLLGPAKWVVALFIGSLLASLVGLYLIGRRRINKSQPIPFVPFLSSGILVSYFFGQILVEWYIG